ncbi:MAG: hypothetical protein C0490_04600 [Marivirga sp.]|nr:hypothetical protein [Marivirga sp.]
MNFRNKPQVIVFLLLVIASNMFKCQTEVALPQLPYEERVIIQGVMEPDSVPIVHFNRTVPYLSATTDAAKLVIRNADITVTTSGESDQLALDSTYLPLDCRYDYFYKGSIKAKRNTTYTLTIIDGAKTYTATTTTALTPVTIDSVSYTPAFKDLYGEHEGVITYFKDIPDEENYYRFEMLRAADVSSRDVTGNNRDLLVPCLQEGDTIMFREIGRSVYSDENLKSQQIKLIIEPALTHEVVVVIFVRIQTIDKSTYEFYEQLDGQKLAQYNPFVEPVFIKDGQFGKAAAGFFGSMVRSEPVRFEMPLDD